MDIGLITYALIAFPGFLGLGLAVFILVSRGGNPELHDVRRRVDALQTSHSDLVDRYDHLQRRVATRLARFKKDAQNASESLEDEIEGETSPMDRKMALRRRWAAQQRGG